MIDRVDRPIDGLFAFSLAGAGVLLIAAGPPRRLPALGLAGERPRGDPADGPVRGLRERLQGARVTRTFATRTSVGFEAERDGVRWWLSADRAGLRCDPPIEGVLPEGEPWRGEAPGGEALVAGQRSLLAEGARAAAAALLRKARERLRRRVNAIDADLEAMEAGAERASFAAIFVPQAATARPGQAALVAVDWSSGEPREVSFPLAPGKGAREQLDALFARSKRLRAGMPAARRRRDEAQLGVLMIDEALDALPLAPDAAAVQALVSALAAELPGDARLSAPSQRQGPGRREGAALPYRRYEGAGGRPILVGRDAAANDELTLHVAGPRDLWLHARGWAGAHVIVPGWDAGASEALLDAATLAAHFSGARGEDFVEVQYAQRRHVRKRRGSPPGQVEATSEKILGLRVEGARLARLLATCDREV